VAKEASDDQAYDAGTLAGAAAAAADSNDWEWKVMPALRVVLYYTIMRHSGDYGMARSETLEQGAREQFFLGVLNWC